MTETTVCPECDISDIKRRTPRGGTPETVWRCANGHEFDEPTRRPATSTQRPTHGLAAKLAAIGEGKL